MAKKSGKAKRSGGIASWLQVEEEIIIAGGGLLVIVMIVFFLF